MRAMTKSAVAVARQALRAGQAALPAYSSPFSRHDFTQAQLFALLVLRQFLRTDYRGVVTLVAEWSELRRALGLKKVPHYSTLCYAEPRVLGKKGGASAACWTPSLGTAARTASSPPGPPPPSTPPGSRRTRPAPTTSTAGGTARGAAGAAAGRS